MKSNLLQKIQKILCYVFLIASAGVLISSFVFFPSSWTQFRIEGQDYTSAVSFYKNMRIYAKMADITKDNYSVVFESADLAKQFYYNFWGDIQFVNNCLFYLGIVGLVFTAIMGIMGNFSRKKYYKSNLVAGITTGIAGIIVSIVTIIMAIILLSKFNYIQPDLDEYYYICEEYYKVNGLAVSYEIVSFSNCLIAIIVPVLFICVCAAIIVFTVLKYKQTSVKEAAINE